jgi:hypothetical protein
MNQVPGVAPHQYIGVAFLTILIEAGSYERNVVAGCLRDAFVKYVVTDSSFYQTRKYNGSPGVCPFSRETIQYAMGTSLHYIPHQLRRDIIVTLLGKFIKEHAVAGDLLAVP